VRGGESSGLRAYNERLIVGAIRAAGALSKADVARATGLSAQAASVIVNRLLAERVLVKRPKVRGQIGQPQTPIALNPGGAYAVGVKIGRRSVEAVLVDFLGAPVARRRTPHDAPLAGPAMAEAAAAAQAMPARAPRDRVAGVGVAMPGDLHEWAPEMGLAAGALDDWRGLDVAGRLGAATGLPAVLCNDATAACAAELAVGGIGAARSALYIYLGSFVGGGLVLEGRLQRGAQGNAAALGSMPMAEADAAGRPLQLIHAASPVFLARALQAAGIDADAAIGGTATLAQADALFAAWRDRAAPALARAIVAAASVVDVEAVVIDGLLNPRWLGQVAQATKAALPGMNRAGLSPFALTAGRIGADARVLGAALLPLQERYAPHPDLVLRSPPGAEAAHVFG
jgi:predicted NBD/HSP70 family sugar kinase